MPLSDALVESIRAWLRLTQTPGIGTESQRKLLQAFGPPENILNASRASLRGVIGTRADALFEHDIEPAVTRTLKWLEEPTHHFITLGDEEYPSALLTIPDPPNILYLRGNVSALSRPALAIVGSRHATPQGLENATAFARILAQQGYCIVSGLALGIDAAAHQAALQAGGTTLAVIGTGADRLYPAQNRALALSIVEQGAIVSEFPLGTPAIASNFPRRNRIISALAQGVLVVEAAVQSGSLITARVAAEQGREVFAIPGSIHSPVARGCHQLIKQGAKLVETAEDILLELPSRPATSSVPPARALQDSPPPLTHADPKESDHWLLLALGHDPCTLDELITRTGAETTDLLSELLTLELTGAVSTLPGNRYQRRL